MKNIINIIVILVLSNAFAYGFWDENDSGYKQPIRIHSVDGEIDGNPYQKIETLDFSTTFPALEWLILAPIHANAAQKDLKNVIDDMGLSNNLNLKTMTVSGDIFGKIISATYLPNLNTLHIEGAANDINFSGFPNLKEINFRYCHFNFETLENLSQLPCLEKLTFIVFADESMEHFNEDSFELLGNCQTLKKLHITTKSPNAGYIKQRLQAVLPNTDVRVGFKRTF
jgi:hypothetical protein